MAIEPFDDSLHSVKQESQLSANGYANHNDHSDSESCRTDDDEDSDELHVVTIGGKSQRLAVACDDGSLRIYNVSDTDGINYNKSFPRVSGRVLSVVWSLNGKKIFSGSSDGLIRCWDVSSFHEAYRITVGLGGLGSGPELCVWSLLFLRCGTLVSGDSSGSVQFWDSQHGTLLQAQTDHKGDVNSLATTPSNRRVFSAGSDGQVVLYHLSNDTIDSGTSREDELPTMNKWVNVTHVRAHTHDVRALTIAVPICSEDLLSDERISKLRRRKKTINFTYRKWAQLGVPMLISAGDDTKLLAYSANEFTQFAPHDICPAPQRVSVQLVINTSIDEAKVILVQYSSWLDFILVKAGSNAAPSIPSGRSATTQLLARFKSKASRKIICSTISSTGLLSAYSDHVKPCLFGLRRHKAGKSEWAISKMKLPKGLSYAHCMIFSADSSFLILAGHDHKIYVVDVKRTELLHIFLPQRKEDAMNSMPSEPPITRMVASPDGQWLAAINCFGDIYIFNLETNRQHWFISRLNGASVTAGGFPPGNSNVLIITTSTNQLYIFDVEARQLGDWSRFHSFILPKRFQDFPGEVIGMSFPPSSKSNKVIVYSTRAMCLIDFRMPIDQDNDALSNGFDRSLEQYDSPKNAKVKRKRKNLYQEIKPNNTKNFDFCAFRDPILFIGHLSENSVLILNKRWIDVAQSFHAPVHRHIFGT